MRRMKWLALCMALVQLLTLLAACGGDETKTSGGNMTSEASSEFPQSSVGDEQKSTASGVGTTTASEEDTSPYLYLVVDGVPQYDIVTALSVEDEVVVYVREFIDDMEALTGATFRFGVESSAPKTEKEILINAYRNREEVKAQLSAPSYTGYRLDVVGKRIVMSTYSVGYIEKMLSLVLDALQEVEQGCWAVDCNDIIIERDLYSDRAIPTYETEAGEVMGKLIYRNAYDGYTVGIEKTNAEEFSAYLQKLERLGYSRYDENRIGMVDFYTYVKDSATLHVQYNTSDTRKGPFAKITLTYGETLPSTVKPTFTLSADARVINPVIDGVGELGNGMSLIFQLGDGSFIIADGAFYYQNDLQRMIGMIKDSTPEGKTPTISLWLWTHAHGDHLDLPRKAMNDFKKAGIEILTFGYNFPSWEDIRINESLGSVDFYSTDIISESRRYYPDAMHWVMHAGQRMYIADATVECLWSHEDVPPSGFYGVNDTSTVFSVTIDGIKTMVLGDCETPNSKMISYYKEAMRSHIVQNSHHTLNGPKLMYEYIDPIISFWARDKAHGINGDGAKTEHGKYLLNTQWTRTDESGATVKGFRAHYSLEEYAEYYIKDLKELYGHLK